MLTTTFALTVIGLSRIQKCATAIPDVFSIIPLVLDKLIVKSYLYKTEQLY